MVFTFYSFKGGVGRSMAMATVGYLLAQRGLKVLVMDFDLEAPGLERYFFDEPTQLAEVRSNPGLIDLVRDYKRALTSEAEFQRAAFKNWPAYVVEAIPQMPGGGSVELMTSGQRYPEARYNDYALAVRAFDWQDFFHNWKGDRFFEWLRRELSAPGRVPRRTKRIGAEAFSAISERTEPRPSSRHRSESPITSSPASAVARTTPLRPRSTTIGSTEISASC